MTDHNHKELNPEQQKAVNHISGPLLIIAGAGTGKTTVITERIKRLIASGKTKPEQILALTFTDKAAREMQERVDVALPYGYADLWISTFHSFCDRILRADSIHLGLDPSYRLLTSADGVQFITANLFKFDLKYFRPLGNPTKFIDGLLSHFSRLHDEDISPAEYLKYAHHQKPGEEKDKLIELAKAFQAYEDLKVKNGLLDFSDLVTHTLRLFRLRKNILALYRQQFSHILVDEFQDTNYAQYALLQLMAPAVSKPNLTVVADDSQSIYRFRGAAISNVLQFMNDYPRAKQVVLIKNYRSSQAILDSAYRLIKHNDPDTLEAKLGIDKNLKAVRTAADYPPEFYLNPRVEDEAETVVKKIKQIILEDNKLQYKDFAILLRANNHAEPFTRALSRYAVPYQFLGPGQLFRQPEVKDLIAYLKILYDFSDNVALYRVLSMPQYAVSGRDLAAIAAFARRQNISFFEACEQVNEIFVSPQTRETVVGFVSMVHRHLDLVENTSAGQLLYYFLEDSGLLKKLAQIDSALEERQVQNISRFFDRLKTYEVDHEDASVRAVIDWINLSMLLGDSPLAANSDWASENKVNLLTVHSAKGLEFPVVFLVNLTQGRFPTYERREQIPLPEDLIKEILPSGDYHLQEERRLFYVGLTRAKDRLILTAANWYGEGKRERRLSPFIYEALGDVETNLVQKPVEQLSFLEWAQPAPATAPLPSQSAAIPVNYLSYSQIDSFNTCPLQYRYRFIQRLPVPPSAALSFGDIVHKALRDFYRQLKTGAKSKPETLLSAFETHWTPVGFASKAQENKMKKEGQRMLTAFYNANKPFTKPLAVEQPFIVKLSPTLKLGGRIDRIDLRGSTLEVTDYKTGKTADQKEADKSLQLTAYALAVTDPGLYGKKPDSVVLTFYFLDSGVKRTTQRTPAQLESVRQEIIVKAKEISQSNFPPTPGVWCDFCDFKLICEAWK